jgi:dynein heavy chain
MIHTSVQKYSNEYEMIYKRRNYSTPKNYLDFITNYMKFLATKRKQLDAAVIRLEGGLTTLEKASDDTQKLSAELAIKNADIAEKKVVVEELIADITEKSEVATKQAKIAGEKKEFLAVQSVEIEAKKQEADKDMEAAQPALLAAQAALSMVKAADITEIKNLASPPDDVRIVCQLTFYFYTADSKDGSWGNVKAKMLSDMKLLTSLKEYDITTCRADQASRAKKLLDQYKKQAKLDGDELQQYV